MEITSGALNNGDYWIKEAQNNFPLTAYIIKAMDPSNILGIHSLQSYLYFQITEHSPD